MGSHRLAFRYKSPSIPSGRRYAFVGISFSHYRRSGGVLSHIVGKAVRDLVVSPLSLVEFIVGNDPLRPLPSLYAQPCVSWKIESRPPYNRCNPNHDLGRKGSGLGTKRYRGFEGLRSARALYSEFSAISSLGCTNPLSLALGCSANLAIDALAHTTRVESTTSYLLCQSAFELMA